MQHIIDLIIRGASYPATWIIKVFGLPNSLSYSRYFLANLMVLSLLVLAWWTFALWRRRGYAFYLGLYLFILLSAVVGFLATIIYQVAWVYAVLTILLVMLIYLVFHRGLHPKPTHRRMLRRFLMLGLIISLGMPIAFSIRQDSQHNHQYNDLLNGLARQKDQIGVMTSQAAAAAASMSSDPAVLAVFQSNGTAITTAQVLATQQAAAQGYLILTDALGQIMVRTDYPNKRYINFFELHPWSSGLYTAQKAISGLAYDEDGRPQVVAGQAIVVGGKFIGAVWTGQYLNPDVTQALVHYSAQNLALAVEKGVTSPAVTGGQGLEMQLFSLAQFESAVREHILFSYNNQEKLMIRYNDQVYLLAAIKLNTLSVDQPVWLISVGQDAQQQWFMYLDLAMVLGIGILIITLLSLSKKLVKKVLGKGEKVENASPPAEPTATEPATEPTPAPAEEAKS